MRAIILVACDQLSRYSLVPLENRRDDLGNSRRRSRKITQTVRGISETVFEHRCLGNQRILCETSQINPAQRLQRDDAAAAGSRARPRSGSVAREEARWSEPTTFWRVRAQLTLLGFRSISLSISLHPISYLCSFLDVCCAFEHPSQFQDSTSIEYALGKINFQFLPSQTHRQLQSSWTRLSRS